MQRSTYFSTVGGRFIEEFDLGGMSSIPRRCHICYGRSNLGFKITKYGLKPDPSKTEAIINFPDPQKKGDVLRFSGMIGYYRRFISNFGKIAKCLFEVRKAKIKFEWSTEREEAFVSLKKHLIEAQILIFPDFNNPFELFCDASATHVGAVLVQRINGVDN
ncbi:unnamed protein product [Brachionus calyciflorus]|uniref:Reverse transcriptase/retrotransposon-derived protein RNase H-like domain-containing protein n=1 Tax=Brachionus calyciflorus TaxID=104777 RepID=A0A814GLN2_9BILA|nr:unnamed protein product [Brachionus calyciflorus]